MTAAVRCVLEGCPSDSADPDFVEDESGYLVGMAFTCRVCGTSWMLAA
jgi:hypothetical protein